MQRILVLGSHLQSFHCFRYLMQAVEGVQVVGLVPHQTQPPIGPGEDVRDIARAHGVPVLGLGDLDTLDFDLGISLMFDRVLPAAIVDRPRKGFVNIHLGPLPRFRGVNSVMHAIRLARRDDHWKFGVTIHYIQHKVDTGPVIELAECPILPDDTAGDLHARACALVPPLFQRHIHRLVESDARVASVPQEGVSYFFKKGPVDHQVDLGLPPDEVYDLVRALTFPGKPRPYAMVGGRKIYLTPEEV